MILVRINHAGESPQARRKPRVAWRGLFTARVVSQMLLSRRLRRRAREGLPRVPQNYPSPTCRVGLN